LATTPRREGRLSRWQLGVGGVLALAAVIRLLSLRSSLVGFDGDEAVTGVMAQRINDGWHFAFYAGQLYQGSLEQYLQAAALAVLPDTAFNLRLPQVALAVFSCWAVYRVGVYALASRGRALVAAFLFAIGPTWNLVWGVKSRGAFASGLALGLGGMLLALSVTPTSRHWRLGMVGFGLCAGVAFWQSWLAG
jgi:hypothetical protein